ncbi:MAG: cobalamin-binding protein [Gammaproteobacteria bacterium]|nr:cobalamin-binding protein [Gammaproteobacteria bacterium]
MFPNRCALLLLGLFSLPVLAEPATRVVALAPNLAEMVYQAGAGDTLVGVVAYSDFPEQVKSLPGVGDAFRVDFEQLAALNPDLVLAWGGGNPKHMLQRVRDLGFRLEVLTPNNLESIADHLELIGDWTGHSEEAGLAALDFRKQLAQLRKSYLGVEPVKVFYQISSQPLYTVNSKQFIGQIIELCGGANIFAELTEMAPVVSPESVVAADPDVILTGSEQLSEVIVLWSRWPRMQAVRQAGILGVDARLVVRASPRLVEGARQVCGALDQVRQGLSNQ